MSSNSYGRENYNAWTWGIAALILLALLWLWITGRGPGSGAACCGAPVAAAAPATLPVTPAPAPTPTPAPASAPAPVAAAPTPAAAPVPVPEPAAPAAAAKPVAKLFFATGKTAVPADTPKTISEVVAYLQKNPQSKAVVSGYNDPRGNAAANAELSKNRAIATREALKAAGIEEARIELRKPAETTQGGDLKEARRVEITIEP